MIKDKELVLLAKEIRNKKAREWRKNNKERVRAINQRYWLKKAKEFKEKEGVE